MSDTTFVDGDLSLANRIVAAWLNDVNNLRYGLGSSTRGSYLLEYMPAGTGAVATTAQAKLRESVSVKDFGAVGNSSTDDSTAFTNALAASNTVVIPSGMTCKIANVFVGANKELFALGSGGIYVAAGTTGLVVGTDAVVASTDWPENIRVHSLSITGEDVSANTIGIRVNQAISGYIGDISFYKCDQVIQEQQCAGFTFNNIHNNDLSDAASDCNYVVYSNVSLRTYDNRYTNCTARAKKECLYLGATSSGSATAIHDGVTITGNRFFPNSTNNHDTVFLRNVFWGTITDNEFFEPQRHCVDVDGTFAGLIISNNVMVYPGQSEYGYGIYVLTASGSAAGAFGSFVIEGNTIVSPSGHAIELNGLQGFTVANNTIIAPNSLVTYSSGTAFTKYGIHMSKCGRYNITGNTITQSLDGRNSTLTPRSWMWDIVCEGDCGFGVIDHTSTLANNSLVLDASIFADVKNRINALTAIPATGDAGNGVDPYYNTAGNWTKTNCTMAQVTDATNPVPNVAGANNTTQIVFTTTTGSTYSGANATVLGGTLIYTAYMRATANNALLTLSLQPNGGTAITKQVVLDTTFRLVTFIYQGTIAAGYSILTITNGGTNTPTVNIAGMDVTTVAAPIAPTFKTSYATAAPVVGAWTVGDRVINKTPTAGQPKGWSCTVTGIPGTWVSEGNL